MPVHLGQYLQALGHMYRSTFRLLLNLKLILILLLIVDFLEPPIRQCVQLLKLLIMSISLSNQLTPGLPATLITTLLIPIDIFIFIR